jgi:mRNA-degrading endonuclease RelE of RelBE toxin-antitoxin system
METPPMRDEEPPEIEGYYSFTKSYLNRLAGPVARVAARLDTTDAPLSALIAEEAERHPATGVVLGAVVGASVGGVVGALLREQPSTWVFGWTPTFKKQIDCIDRKVQGRILQAIADITDEPLRMCGDTQKPLTKEDRYEGCWRLRCGDYRIIYFPDASARRVVLMSFEVRGDAYG